MILLFALTMAGAQPPVSPRPLKVLRLAGSGLEIGRQHGELLKNEIAELFPKWKAILTKTFGQPADSFIRNFLDSSHYARAIRTYTPALWAEIQGLAEGSGQSPDDVLAFQLLDESWVWADRLAHTSAKHHCSGIGMPARDSRPACIAQNMDLDTWMEGYQVVMRITPAEGPEQLVLTCAGLIGLTGMNSAGIAVCVNTLMQLRATTDGLPVACMLRGALSQQDGAAALTFLKTTPHASGQNYLLAIGDEVYDFEASCDHVVQVPPGANGILLHTNHPLVNKDIKAWYAQPQENPAGEERSSNSEIRFASLRGQLENIPAPTIEELKDILRSKTDPANPVCRTLTPDVGSFTFGSVVYTPAGKMNMQVTSGPPDLSAYQTFHFYGR